MKLTSLLLTSALLLPLTQTASAQQGSDYFKVKAPLTEEQGEPLENQNTSFRSPLGIEISPLDLSLGMSFKRVTGMGGGNDDPGLILMGNASLGARRSVLEGRLGVFAYIPLDIALRSSWGNGGKLVNGNNVKRITEGYLGVPLIFSIGKNSRRVYQISAGLAQTKVTFDVNQPKFADENEKEPYQYGTLDFANEADSPSRAFALTTGYYDHNFYIRVQKTFIKNERDSVSTPFGEVCASTKCVDYNAYLLKEEDSELTEEDMPLDFRTGYLDIEGEVKIRKFTVIGKARLRDSEVFGDEASLIFKVPVNILKRN